MERRPRGHRDDLPRNPDQRLVPGQGAHGRAHLLGRRQPGKRLRPVAPGMGQLLQPGHRRPRLYLRLHGIGHVPHLLLLYGQRQKRPQDDKGIYYLRTTAEVTVNDAARPSVTQIVNNAVDLCRQETNRSEYDMALWLHDWTLDQLEYDHSLNWCSAESGLTRHTGTCESYQRIYSKFLDAAGIANGRITGNGHTWNAVKIEGKWCQMDLTWDDTSDNWYGDLDQRHLYFGLTDELMTIAHSDHTANYQKDGYAYRSTDLSNNYFVRNGKADEWVEKYADRIQQHLDAREESFSIDADNQLFPPSISGIQNGIVAYAMNQRRWKVQGAKVVLAATSNVATLPNSTLTVKYDCTAKYQAAQVKPVQSVPDGEYMICNRGLGTAMLDISGASRSNGANAQLWEANGSGVQRFMISYDECAGAYEIMCAASGLALDVDCADFSSGANVQLYESNGSAAQSWRLAATGRNPLSDRHGEGT